MLHFQIQTNTAMLKFLQNTFVATYYYINGMYFLGRIIHFPGIFNMENFDTCVFIITVSRIILLETSNI